MRGAALAWAAAAVARPWLAAAAAGAAAPAPSGRRLRLPPQLAAACGGGQTFPYAAWSAPIKSGTCSPDGTPVAIHIKSKSGCVAAAITCELSKGIKTYRFSAGIYEIDEQLLVPERTEIVGASNPNDMAEPTRSPDWGNQTLFLATRGATDYSMNYCHAKDMVKTRVGFVLSSDVAVRDVSYQGIDTIRPNDNGALCGGAVFETKGCAENDCKVSDVNTGGSDGVGSVNVTVENVRLNDYYYAEDAFKVGYAVPGNYDCRTGNFSAECCFCLPNGVRSSQVGFWTPETRNPEGTRNVVVRNMVASSTQADGINLHGRVVGAVVEGAYFQNAGDDTYAVWGGASDPEDIVFRDCVAVNPGVLRPNWYGNCVATYGLKSVTFEGLTCRAPTLEHPIPSPDGGGVQIGLSMFVFQNSFWATYAKDNSILIEGWKFETLAGAPYTASDGSMNKPEPQKFAWTRSENGVVAPYYVTSTEQVLHVVAIEIGNRGAA